MKKALSIIALLLCLLMVFSACVPFENDGDDTDSATESVSETESESESEADTKNEVNNDDNKEDNKEEEKEEEPVVTVIKIRNADQLLSILENSKKDNWEETSKNIVYELQRDIEFNSDWDATVGEDANGNITSTPSAPDRVWTGIDKFYGTIDGNGYSISGLYMEESLEDGDVCGFIKELCGGTIKNITINNSYISVNVDEEAENVLVGVLVGKVSENSTIENVTVEAGVKVTGNDTATVKGVYAKVAEGVELTSAELTDNAKVWVVFDSSSIIRVGTAEELLAAIAAGGDFAGKTLKLTADIDLNPGWSATVTFVDGKVVYPAEPAVVWTKIDTFKGTLDGNGHTLSGIYAYMSFSSTSASGWSPVIGTLDGGTIKDLAIKNSITIVKNTAGYGTANVGVGGLIGTIKGNTAVLRNLYSEMEVWFQFHEQASVGGYIGYAATIYTAENIVFAGRLGNTNNDLVENYATADNKVMRFGQIVGNHNWKTNAALKNALAIGVIKSGNYVMVNDYSATNDNAEKLVKTNCLAEKQNADYLTANSDFADAGWVYDEDLGYILPKTVLDLIK